MNIFSRMFSRVQKHMQSLKSLQIRMRRNRFWYVCAPTHSPTLRVRQRRDVLLFDALLCHCHFCVSCLSLAALHSSKITLSLHYSLSELRSLPLCFVNPYLFFCTLSVTFTHLFLCAFLHRSLFSSLGLTHFLPLVL